MNRHSYMIEDDSGKKKSFAKEYIRCYESTKRGVPKLISVQDIPSVFFLEGKGAKLLAELLREGNTK
tara:strand:+ start:1433 stop:1633 length:201 start_codon:yes stop_codon:yes gene_type:complete